MRYIANEAWSNLKALTLGKFDIYHPTTYLRMADGAAKRMVATHHDCTHELFPELFPDVKKVCGLASGCFPRLMRSFASRSHAPGSSALLQMSIRPNLEIIHHGLTALTAERGSRCNAPQENASELHSVRWNEGSVQEFYGLVASYA